MKSLRAYLAAAALAIAGIAGAGNASAKPAIFGAHLCAPLTFLTVRIHLQYQNKDLMLVYHVHGRCFRHLVRKYYVYHNHHVIR